MALPDQLLLGTSSFSSKDRVVVDREHEMEEWAKVIARLLARNVRVYAFANNHYSGHAPAALALFETAFTKHAVARTAP